MFFGRGRNNNNNSNNESGYRAPHIGSKQNAAERQAATREHVEKTRHDLNVQLQTSKINVQRAIQIVRNIDSRPPVMARERMNAMRMLRMYVGQQRVVQAMVDNIDMVHAELVIRENTQEFGQSMSEMTKLIQQYNAHACPPGKLVQQLRGVLKPTQSMDALKQYDKMYDELSSIYGTEDDSNADGISNAWLEQLVSGAVSYDAPIVMENEPLYTADPVEYVQQATNPAPAPAQQQKVETNTQDTSNQAIMDMLKNLGVSLRD